MSYKKRIISGALSTVIGGASVYGACTSTTLIATAYYSPLPDQETYVMGDLESEKILQGEGTHGASGRAVFDGMLAASPNYPFGTQIVIDGWGIGQVEDRGGAIVQAGERDYKYDRIDIRMGYGDEGRKTALNRGKRTISGTVCSPNTYQPTALGTDSINQNLRHGSTGGAVSLVQQYLIDAGYLKRSKPTSYFGHETTSALCQWQIDNNITTANSGVCGLYGPATRAAMWEHIPNPSHQKKNLHEITQEPTTEANLATSNSQPVTTNSSTLYALGESGFHIIALQEQLFRAGYYQSDITGRYDKATHNARKEQQTIIAQQEKQ